MSICSYLDNVLCFEINAETLELCQICICNNELTSLLLTVSFCKCSQCPFILFKAAAREALYRCN